VARSSALIGVAPRRREQYSALLSALPSLGDSGFC